MLTAPLLSENACFGYTVRAWQRISKHIAKIHSFFYIVKLRFTNAHFFMI